MEEWNRFVDNRAFEALAAALIETHYDPAYRRAARKIGRRKLGAISLAEGAEGPLNQAAAESMLLLGSIGTENDRAL